MGNDHSGAVSARGFLSGIKDSAQSLPSCPRLPVRSRGRHSRHFGSLASALTSSLRSALSLSRGRGLRRNQPQCLAHLGLQLGHYIFVIFQKLAGILASLTDAFSFVAVPGTRFLQDVLVRRQVEQIALARNPLAIENVEFGFAEGGGDFVLYDF